MAQETLLGFPAHTLYPQGVCSIRKAAKPLTAALPYRRGEFTTLSTASFLFIQPLFYTKSSPTARGPSASCKLFRFPTIFVEHLRPLCYTGCCNIVYCVPAQDTLLGFPAHTLHPQGVCGIRKAAQPLTAALPYRCGGFTTLLTVSLCKQFFSV